MSQPMHSAPDAPSESTSDEELLALPTPPRRTRALSFGLMVLTSILALSMVWALSGELSYALEPSEPRSVGRLSELSLAPELANRFVVGRGEVSLEGGVTYERFLEADRFRVVKVVDNPRLWIELRQTTEPSLPQTSFVGRLVPLSSAGIQYRGLAAEIAAQDDDGPAGDRWLLVEGAAPASSYWALALGSLLLAFASWNLAQLARLARRVR